MLIYDFNIEKQLFLFGKEPFFHVFPANLSVGVILDTFLLGLFVILGETPAGFACQSLAWPAASAYLTRV